MELQCSLRVASEQPRSSLRIASEQPRIPAACSSSTQKSVVQFFDTQKSVVQFSTLGSLLEMLYNRLSTVGICCTTFPTECVRRDLLYNIFDTFVQQNVDLLDSFRFVGQLSPNLLDILDLLYNIHFVGPFCRTGSYLLDSFVGQFGNCTTVFGRFVGQFCDLYNSFCWLLDSFQ